MIEETDIERIERQRERVRVNAAEFREALANYLHRHDALVAKVANAEAAVPAQSDAKRVAWAAEKGMIEAELRAALADATARGR